jgi:hypothetical protein
MSRYINNRNLVNSYLIGIIGFYSFATYIDSKKNVLKYRQLHDYNENYEVYEKYYLKNEFDIAKYGADGDSSRIITSMLWPIVTPIMMIHHVSSHAVFQLNPPTNNSLPKDDESDDLPNIINSPITSIILNPYFILLKMFKNNK